MARRTYSADGLGPEPITTIIQTETELAAALSWYSIKDYREIYSIVTYMQHEGYREAEVAKVESREKFLEKSLYAMCRLMEFSCVSLELQDSVRQRIKDRLSVHINAPAAKVPVVDQNAPPKRSKASTRLSHVLEDIEAVHDLIITTHGYINFSPAFVPTAEEKAELTKIYRPRLEELQAVQGRTDPELVEAYGNLSTARLHKLIFFYGQIVGAEAEAKVEPIRKPRKKRAPNFSKLKYMLQDEETGLKSLNPVMIHGCASVAVVYNTKYQSVTVYVAEEGKFLEFKRTSIVNVDEEKSFTKKAGRSKTLINVLTVSNSKASILKEIQSINSKPTKASSLISDCVILAKGFR